MSAREVLVRSVAARFLAAHLAGMFGFSFLLAALLVFPRVGQTSPQSAPPPAASPERALFDAANRERAAKGLAPLRWDDSLATAAREHAQLLAQRNILSHQFPGEPPVEDRARQAGARYSVIAENVAEGATPEAIHSGWMHSAPHRANLLAPELTSVGIAVAASQERRISGRVLFAVEDFSLAVANLSYEEQERQVASLLAKRGLQSSDAREEARRTCETDHGMPGSRATMVVRYEAADLSRLPENLEREIQSGSYHTAAVGACDPVAAKGSMRFRVAVLLY
jgi:Cysteine-rich secretory protein family